VQTGHTATVYAELNKSYGWYGLTVKTPTDAGFSRQLVRHV